ncbi:hypothetical protein B0H15DRAFT_816262 [Mycena belliarum]|uniref:Uncharacterized protein n=1 Tax=Mycena belliarum TaxID=1033014 RepID=A0AAD6UGI9_9AGAR|nr:hypothetical protein B0H15DRAFT_816262 [Mycena belliae]
MPSDDDTNTGEAGRCFDPEDAAPLSPTSASDVVSLQRPLRRAMPKVSPERGGSFRNVRFTPDEDQHLVHFIATQDTRGRKRGGRKLYEVLGPKASDIYLWSRHRQPESWWRRYTNQSLTFDLAIRKYKVSQCCEEEPIQLRPRLPTAPPPIRTAGARIDAAPTTAPNTPPHPGSSKKVLALECLKSHLTAEQAASQSTNPPDELAHLSSVDRSSSRTETTDGKIVAEEDSPPVQPAPALRRTKTKTHVVVQTDSSPKDDALPAAVQVQPHVIPAPSPTTPDDVTTPLTAAHAQAKTHRKLARAARRSKMFSLDRAWALYAQTGSVAHTREVLRTAAQDAQQVCGDADVAAAAAVHKALARLARQSEVLSVDAVWAVYARVGSVAHTREVVRAMGDAAKRVEGDPVGRARDSAGPDEAVPRQRADTATATKDVRVPKRRKINDAE